MRANYKLCTLAFFLIHLSCSYSVSKNDNTNEKLLHATLTRVFIEDSILFQRISFVIHLQNLNSVLEEFRFKKEESIYRKNDISSAFAPNGYLEIFNLSNKKIDNLNLSILYPDIIKLPKEDSVNLLFISNRENIFNLHEQNYSDKAILKLDNILKRSIKLRLKIFYHGNYDWIEVHISDDVAIKNGSPHIPEI